jgi:hypothetical protein
VRILATIYNANGSEALNPCASKHQARKKTHHSIIPGDKGMYHNFFSLGKNGIIKTDARKSRERRMHEPLCGRQL